jgi:hypothetical protein
VGDQKILSRFKSRSRYSPFLQRGNSVLKNIVCKWHPGVCRHIASNSIKFSIFPVDEYFISDAPEGY